MWNRRTQGMTEFILLIGLMVIAAVLIAAVFGSNQKGLFQASKNTLQDGREFAEMSESAGSDATKDSGAHSSGNLAGTGSDKEDTQLRESSGGKAQSEKFVPPGPESKKYAQSAGDDPRKSRSSTGGFYTQEPKSNQNTGTEKSGGNTNSQSGGFNTSENKSGSASKTSGGDKSASGGFSGGEVATGNATQNPKNVATNDKNSSGGKTESSKSGGFQGQDASKNPDNKSGTASHTSGSGSGSSSSGSSGGNESGGGSGGSSGGSEGGSGGSDPKKSKPIEPDEKDRLGWSKVDLEQDPLYWKRLRDVRALEHANVYTNKNPNSIEVKQKFEALVEAYNHPKFFPSRARYESWLRKGGRETPEYQEQNAWYYLKMQEIMAGYEGRRSF